MLMSLLDVQVWIVTPIVHVRQWVPRVQGAGRPQVVRPASRTYVDCVIVWARSPGDEVFGCTGLDWGTDRTRKAVVAARAGCRSAIACSARNPHLRRLRLFPDPESEEFLLGCSG